MALSFGASALNAAARDPEKKSRSTEALAPPSGTRELTDSDALIQQLTRHGSRFCFFVCFKALDRNYVIIAGH